jgi:hypothetical protein
MGTKTISFKDLNKNEKLYKPVSPIQNPSSIKQNEGRVSPSSTRKTWNKDEPIKSDDGRQLKLPYYHNLTELQQRMLGVFPVFPLQSHSDFFGKIPT